MLDENKTQKTESQRIENIMTTIKLRKNRNKNKKMRKIFNSWEMKHFTSK